MENNRDSRKKDKSRSPRKHDADEEDPDDRYERLRQERQFRDKEQAYQEVLHTAFISGFRVKIVFIGFLMLSCGSPARAY